MTDALDALADELARRFRDERHRIDREARDIQRITRAQLAEIVFCAHDDADDD